jgi:hypothetical protein
MLECADKVSLPFLTDMLEGRLLTGAARIFIK